MTSVDPPNDLPTATGLGHALFDHQSLFYLQNRAQIEEWAGLRPNAGRATRSFLELLAEPISQVVTPSLVVKKSHVSSYVHLYIVPEATPVAAEQPPPISMAFGWNGGQCTSLDDATWGPFISVRVRDAGAPEALRFKELLTPELCDGYQTSDLWPVWRKVLASGPWWNDLDAYVELVKDEVRLLRTKFEPLIDQALMTGVPASGAES